MFASPTNKQIAVLKRLQQKSPMVASWNHADLTPLHNMGFVARQTAYQTSGRVSRNVVWTISDQGRRFLEEERAGR